MKFDVTQVYRSIHKSFCVLELYAKSFFKKLEYPNELKLHAKNSDYTLMMC